MRISDWSSDVCSSDLPDALFLERAPRAVEAVIVAAVVERQPINVDQVGPVHRVGPAEIFIMPEEGIGRAGEVGAGEIPALFAVDDQLVPGDAAGDRKSTRLNSSH